MLRCYQIFQQRIADQTTDQATAQVRDLRVAAIFTSGVNEEDQEANGEIADDYVNNDGNNHRNNHRNNGGDSKSMLL